MMFFKPSTVATTATTATETAQDCDLSQLSQKSQVTIPAETPESVATVAKVATGQRSLEPQNPALAVTIWAPTGNPMQVQARDADHAAFLIRMNPRPERAEPRREAMPTVDMGDDRQTLLAYLAAIGEDDPAIINELLTECAKDADTLAGVMRQACDVLAMIEREAREERAGIVEFGGG